MDAEVYQLAPRTPDAFLYSPVEGATTMAGFLIRMAITAFGLWLASQWISGISIRGLPTVLGAAVLLGVVNAVIRPVVVFLTLPITFVTLGLFLWVINAAMIGIVAWLLPGFHVAGLGSAMLAALILGVTGWIGSAFVGSRGRYEMIVVRQDESVR